MYSGEDSSGDALSNKNVFSAWPLGQSPCIMNNDRIDWAALAQQWIQMKESCSDVTGTQNINKAVESYEEQGEAPMEVVKDDEVPAMQNSCNNTAFSNRDWSTTWYSQDQAQLSSNWEHWNTVSTNTVQMPAVQSVDFFKSTSLPLLKSGSSNQNSELPPMDVAKKKILPAWIREGLEKMEKEKQKQLEKLKRTQHCNIESNSISEEVCVKDILQSGSDDSDSDDEKREHKISNLRVGQETQVKSKEEILEELTLVVRKSLTELLLEVTNEEILNIAQESFRKYKSKATSAQVFRKSAISSITGKLGLGAYADSASENSESESDHSVNENDSEEEIKENIRLRQNEFKFIAQDIEIRVRQFEEKQQGGKEAGSSVETPDGLTRNCIKDSGETQPDKKGQSDDKRSKERTSRFSATKECKQKYNSYVVQAAAIPCSSYDYNKRKSKDSRRTSYSSDSSSDNGNSYKKIKRRIRSRDDKNWKDDSQCGSNLVSSDSDDYRKRKHHKSHIKERSRSRSHSRSSSHSHTSKRSEKRY